MSVVMLWLRGPNALAWYDSGDSSYAKNAIRLMNKWSYAIKDKFEVCVVLVLADRFQAMHWTSLFCRQPGLVPGGPEQGS
jgi:hypothetical protein